MQIMDEFDNDNLYYENESDAESPIQGPVATVPAQDAPEPQNRLMVEDEMPLFLDQPLDVVMNEIVPQPNELVDQPIVINNDKENDNPFDLLKAAAMPPPPPPTL